MRFLLDENLPPVLAEAIYQLDSAIDVKYVRGPGAPSEGAPDPDVLLFCQAEQRARVTNNHKSIPTHEHDHFAAGFHHFGIFWLREGHSYAEYAEAIHLLWAASEAEEWIDRSDWLPWM